MVKKAVIPAAGFGTRFLPATKAVPKEMLPVVDKPVIQYVVEEAVASGISEITVVVSSDKRAIREHFGRHMVLEHFLERRGRVEEAAALKRLAEMVKIDYVLQPEMRGLGDAIGCAREQVGDEPFAVLLGDTIVESVEPVTMQLISAYKKCGTSVVAVEEVPLERVSRYGVISGKVIDGGLWRVDKMVEKPLPDEAPSRLVVCSRYLLTPDIFTKLERVKPGKGGEIQLTDALQLQAAESPIHAVEVDAVRYDVGNAAGFVRANLALALQRPEMRDEIAAAAQQLLAERC
ncbi:MAG: UTP--glucose-1-phosphate uridylyltransferase GalU [Lentisphaerae bacterium]|nr:UTP--glucose-1-phosphate uridylyltransferase GalU [Lentisphaerota bacterium]